MIHKILKTIVGTRNDRILRQYRRIVAQINALAPTYKALTDEQLAAKTTEFKQRVAAGISLDQLLPSAFATVREASARTLGMRHFDVQLIGGMVLHFGKISEMRTGEGKTLMATLAAYLNALTGHGVHIVTVNDYLARRDAAWMSPVYEFLGLTVGVNVADLSAEEKKAAYAADITYGTNNEFGFDYLRDNMVYALDQRVQRPLPFAIVDEVDSILIDEARTPLIISGQAEASSDLYEKINQLVPLLKKQLLIEDQKEEEVAEELRGDYTVDEKNKQALLTEKGHQYVESLLVEKGLMQAGQSLYDTGNITLMHYVSAALRAHSLFHKDVHYIVKNDEILIVDEHTGRLMPGRRWSEGLHQAVEAKEGVSIQLENQTLASITFQNYFRLYEKLSGMTGTADTEAYELQKIYGLEVVIVPTNKPLIRKDLSDRIYLTASAKYNAIVQEISVLHQRGQPVLVGTASIESSEWLHQLLNKEKIEHAVLNAKHHAREAKIIADAGRLHAVTIATNMAGRGTDIVLGGNLEVQLAEQEGATEAQVAAIKANWQKEHDQVVQLGGLFVLGTERNEARRIDNQLRGRSGRQGDPGGSQFYLSLEDNLLRVFASDRMSQLMRRLGVTESDVIESKMVSRAIENAQRRVEGHNFDIRKNLLEYDDVANDQRQVIYQQRLTLLEADDITPVISDFCDAALSHIIAQFIPPGSLEETWEIAGLERQLQEDFAWSVPLQKWLDEDDGLDESLIHQRMTEQFKARLHEKEAPYDSSALQSFQKAVLLQVIDTCWKEHLAAMDYLRQGIHLRGYAQKNPAQEYKKESYEMFDQMLSRIKYDVVSQLARVQYTDDETAVADHQAQPQQNIRYHHEVSGVFSKADQGGGASSAIAQPVVRAVAKVGRNAECPCGSGKKYKVCHGKIA